MHFSLQHKISTFKPDDDIINIETGRNDNKKTLIINKMSTREEIWGNADASRLGIEKPVPKFARWAMPWQKGPAGTGAVILIEIPRIKSIKHQTSEIEKVWFQYSFFIKRDFEVIIANLKIFEKNLKKL